MSRMNCWEYKQCGREPGGDKTEILGVCPAAIESKVDGSNSGKNAGRACWPTAGTLCEGEVQGVYATKFGNCIDCDFFKLVCEEEEQVERAVDVLKKISG